MKKINNAQIMSIALVAEADPKSGVYPITVVHKDPPGWRCVQTDCDGERHYYVSVNQQQLAS